MPSMNKEMKQAKKTAKANKRRSNYVKQRNIEARGRQILKTEMTINYKFEKIRRRLQSQGVTI